MIEKELLIIHKALRQMADRSTPENIKEVNSLIVKIENMLEWGACKDCRNQYWVVYGTNSRFCAVCRKTHGI